MTSPTKENKETIVATSASSIGVEDYMMMNAATEMSTVETANNDNNSNEFFFNKRNSRKKILFTKLFGDVAVACSVTLGIAPFISIIDKSVVQKASGTHTIVRSCIESTSTMIRNPVNFFKSPMLLMMWGVYAATYTTANCLKTIVEHQNLDKEIALSDSKQNKNGNNTLTSLSNAGTFGVFSVTTVVNSAASIMKDRFYARNFGCVTKAKMPPITYCFWGMRDCVVIGSSFILPELMCNIIEEQTNMDKRSALQISQFTCPMLAQIVATPLQMLGLDHYNRPLAAYSYKTAIMERIKFQFRNFSSILGARVIRIAPSYGIGGIGNTYFRDLWREYVNFHTDGLSKVNIR